MTLHRVEKLRKKLVEKQLDAIIVDSPYNRRYLSGFTGSAGTLVITQDEQYLLTDFRYRIQSKEQAPSFSIIEYKTSAHVDVKQILANHKATRVAFEEDQWTYSQFKGWEKLLSSDIELVGISNMIEDIRMVKDADELKVIQEAALLADKTFAYILNYIEVGKSEKDIALEMETFMRKNGASGTSFETIVASGERSALPHGVASDRILKNNEFVKLDFGAYYQGYCSDMTRTVFLGQEPTEKHYEIYNTVLEAQLLALRQIKPGITGLQADAFARDHIASKGYGDLFGHSTGHGIGLEIHEGPRLSKLSETVLTPGMVVTVEPGIYVPNFGGVRIEDDIVITDTGIQILTQSTKELILL